MTNVNAQTTDWQISDELQSLLYELVKERAGACIITFSDPRYSAETGGYHPVEVMVGATGDIGYITDFTYVGLPPDTELVKEIDFDFSNAIFQHMGYEYPLTSGRGLYQIWESNFCAFHKMGVFTTSVEETN